MRKEGSYAADRVTESVPSRGFDGGFHPGEFVQAVRAAARVLIRRPSFSTMVVLSVGMGIALTSSMISVVRGTLFHPFPYEDADHLRILLGHWVDSGGTGALGIPDLEDLADRAPQLGPIGISSRTVQMGLFSEERREPLKARFVNRAYFTVLGLPVALGRGFGAEADRPPAVDEVVLTHETWTRHFSSDPSVIGRAITLSGRSYEVVGVMPPAYRDPGEAGTPAGALLPLSVAPPFLGSQMFERRAARQYGGLIRVAHGLGPAATDQHLLRVSKALETLYPESNENFEIRAYDLRQRHFGSSDIALWTLLAGAATVLLLCCINVTALIAEFGNGRRRESAVRLALGSGRRRLASQALMESGLLVAAGGVVGVLVGAVGLRLAESRLDLGLPSFVDLSLDSGALIWILALVLGTGIAVGLRPAIQAGRASLRGEFGNTPRARRQAATLLAVEAGLTTLLLVGAGLAARNLIALASIPLGYETDNALTFTIDLTRANAPGDSASLANFQSLERQRRTRFAEQFIEQVEELAGVTGATLAGPDALGRANWGVAITPSHLDPEVAGQWWAHTQILMTENSFQVLGIPLHRGRGFTRSDRAGSPLVAVVDRTFAAKHWPDSDPLGKQFYTHPGRELWSVVGVAGSTRQNGRLTEDPEGYVYFPFAQKSRPFISAVVRARRPATVADIAGIVHQLDPDAVLYDVSTASARLERQEWVPRLTSSIAGLYAFITAIMAMVGVHGVLSHQVRRAAKGLAVRAAVGAGPRRLAASVVASGLRPVSLGVGAGLVVAAAAAQVFRGLVVYASLGDPVVFGGTAAFLLGATVVSCLVPALRASAIAPAELLRNDS